MIHLLAATNSTAPSDADGGGLFLDVLPWMAVILLLALILIATIYLGKRLFDASQRAPDEPFSLQTLRDLHASGQMTDEEFERAKSAMIGRITAQAPPDKEEYETDDETKTDAAKPPKRTGDNPPASDNNADGKPPA